MVDTATKTNNKGRPVGCINGTDGEMKSTLALMALLLNERLHAFHFMLICMGFIYGKAFMRCVSVFISDGDNQIISTINQFIAISLLNPLTQCRGCYWHAVTQPLLKKFSKDNKKSCLMQNGVMRFMNLCGKSQTEEEINHY